LDFPHGIFGKIFMPDDSFHATRRAILHVSVRQITSRKHGIISHQRLVNRVLPIQKPMGIGVPVIPIGLGVNDLQAIVPL
jgi:hypothetical protein